MFSLGIIFVFYVSVSGLTCEGNCPSDSCYQCLCGTHPVTSENSLFVASEWCSKYTWNYECCICTITAKSGLNPKASNFNLGDPIADLTDDGGTEDVGLFQINSVNWECNNNEPPCYIVSNFKCAVDVYQWGGNTWEFWGDTSCGCENTP